MKQITEVEQMIVDARQKGLSFCNLVGSDISTSIDQIMLRGAAITGCPLPATEFFAQYIADEILIFINDFGFKEYTLEEILLALRINSKGGLKYPSGTDVENIPFEGKTFNVVFLAKVLGVYATLRRILDQRAKNHIDGF
jgi:hypothetical protein